MPNVFFRFKLVSIEAEVATPTQDRNVGRPSFRSFGSVSNIWRQNVSVEIEKTSNVETPEIFLTLSQDFQEEPVSDN